MRTPQVLTVTATLIIFVAGAFFLAGRTRPPSAIPPPAPNAIVIAELFTSEGCSSCPPADELLTRLTQQQPLTGVTILGMGEHVDYWNRLGWSDPFSSAAFSERQAQYAARLPNSAGGPYTPQLVIDGAQEEVGSYADAVTHKIAQAAVQRKATVNVATLPSKVGSYQIQIRVEVPPEVAMREPADVVIAITEDNISSDVRRGENSGRHLRHNSVVRSMQTAGTLKAPLREWSGAASINILPDWKLADLKVIGFLQEQHSRRIVGVGWTRVDAPRS
jgi:hypothetical protein